MMCPVALFAIAVTWVLRAGVVLLVRVSSAVALAAVAFSAAIIVAEHIDDVRSLAPAGQGIVLSRIVDQPVIGGANGAANGWVTVAAVAPATHHQ